MSVWYEINVLSVNMLKSRIMLKPWRDDIDFHTPSSALSRDDQGPLLPYAARPQLATLCLFFFFLL